MKLSIPLIVVFLMTPAFLLSQSVANQKAYHTWFDAQIGVENTALFNGAEYIEGYKTTREHHKFFINQSFYSGEVQYDGQTYYNIDLKYDIYEDELIASLEGTSQKSFIQLIKPKVTQFNIEGHTFVNITNLGAFQQGIYGYHEVLTGKESNVFYKKHRKRRVKKEDKRILYFEFFDAKSDFVLLYNNTYYSITSRNDVYAVFPELKPELKEFFNGNDALRRSSKEKQLLTLFNKAMQLTASKTSN